jgi:hypothetical protein
MFPSGCPVCRAMAQKLNRLWFLFVCIVLFACYKSDTSKPPIPPKLRIHHERIRPILSNPLLSLRGGQSNLLDRLSVDVYGEALTIESVDVEVSPSFNNEYNLTFLASTAGSIAAYRAAVTFFNSSYIDDPFAIMFAREINPDKLAAAKLKNSSELARFAVRTRFFDEFLRESVFRSGIRQVLA